MTIATSVRTNEHRPFTAREAAARCGLSPRNLRRLSAARCHQPLAAAESRVTVFTQPFSSVNVCRRSRPRGSNPEPVVYKWSCFGGRDRLAPLLAITVVRRAANRWVRGFEPVVRSP
jgi:hypothetical protein